MKPNSPNSFRELDREAHDVVDLAKFCRLPTLPAELHTAQLRTDLARLFVEEKATDQNIAELVAGFRRNLLEAQCPVEINSFMGAIVGLAARVRENADTALVDEFEQELREALSVISKHDKFSWGSVGLDKSEELQENISALMHATVAMCNFDPQQMTYASQGEVDSYFYTSYYHGIKCRSGDMWIDVKMQKRQEEDEVRLPKTLRRKKRVSRYEEMGDLAHRFTNSFFNFLHQASEHPRCSRALRTVIRTHLIDFNDSEAVELNGWEKPFDVSRLDLRVSKDDLEYTNTESHFRIKRGEPSDYCRDA